MNSEAKDTMTMIGSWIVIFFGFPAFMSMVGGFNDANLTFLFLIFWIACIAGLGYQIKKRIRP